MITIKHLCGACIVTLVALGFSAAPARAQNNFSPLPPQVRFISNGKYAGTLQIQGLTLPINGTLAYLASTQATDTDYLHISVDTLEGLITSDSWQITTPTVTNEWEILSIFPKICRNEVLSGASFPQCTSWTRNFQGAWLRECTVTAQGNNATLVTDSSVILNENNQLVSLKESTTIKGDESDMASIAIIMQEQGTTPPSPSDFNRPSICPAPNSNNQVEQELVCTGTIPNICF